MINLETINWKTGVPDEEISNDYSFLVHIKFYSQRNKEFIVDLYEVMYYEDGVWFDNFFNELDKKYENLGIGKVVGWYPIFN